MSKIIALGFGLWSAVVSITTLAISLFLPLNVPGGYSAEHVDSDSAGRFRDCVY